MVLQPVATRQTRLPDSDLPSSLRAFLWSRVVDLWKLPPQTEHVPSSNPVSIMRKDLSRIRKRKSIVSLKTDGVRHLLLLTTTQPESTPIAVMIDRNKNMYEVGVVGHSDFFSKESLFDGELVWRQPEETELKFIMFDAIAVKGIACKSFAYHERLTSIMQSLYTPSEGENSECNLEEEVRFMAKDSDINLVFYSKPCSTVDKVCSVWERRNLETHRNDGLILTWDDCGVELGAAKSTFKWKPTHTVDAFFDPERGTLLFNSNASASLVSLEGVASEVGKRCVVKRNAITESVSRGAGGAHSGSRDGEIPFLPSGSSDKPLRTPSSPLSAQYKMFKRT